MNRHAVPQSNIEQDNLLIDIATRNVICLAPKDSIGAAASIMARKRISSLVVTDADGHPVGIVTERNMLRAMQDECPTETPLQDVMSAPVITVPETISCLDAYQLCLRDGIRHLVIVDGDQRLFGVISETDFRLHLNLTALTGRRKIAAVARRAALTLPPSASLAQALSLMLDQHKSCTVVVEDNKPVGIITERDVVRFYSDAKDCANLTLRQAMVVPVLTIPFDAPTSEAAELMLTRKVRHLVVVDEAGCMAGLVSEHELTQAMATGMAQERGGIDDYFLHTLVNTLPDLVWLKDVDGVYLACNVRFENFFGAQEKDIVGKTDYDFMSRELAEFFRGYDRKAMEKDDLSINEEWVTFANDGHRELLETIKTPMRDSRGRLIGVLGIARDITERVGAEAALRASEEKLRGLYELSPMGIALTDMQGHYVEFNDAFREICGYTREELNQLDYWALTPKEYADKEAEQLHSLNTKGYYGPYEKEYIRKDGNRIPLRLNGVLIHDHSGKPYIWSIVEDVTERKRAENALRENEERLALATLHNGVGIWDWNLATQQMVWDDSMYALYHIRREDFSGTEEAWRASLHPDDLERGDREVKAAIRGEKPFDTEFRVIWPSGEIRHIKAVAKVFRDAQGTPVRMLGTNVDITERKQAEEMLRKLSAAVEQSAASVVITDLEARIQYVNPHFVENTGYSAAEVIGKNPRILQSGQTSKETYHELWGKLTRGQEWSGELLNKRKNGERCWEDVSIAPIRDSQGVVTHYVAVKTDITERKRMEQALLEQKEFLASIFENALDAVMLMDDNGVITGWSKQAEQIFGWSRADAVGRLMHETIVPVQYRETHMRGMRHFLSTGEGPALNTRIEISALHRDGREFPVELSISPIRTANGYQFSSFIRDISRRKHLEQQLTEREKLFRAIFEQAPNGVELIDPDALHFIEANPAACRMLGYTREEYLRLRLIDTQVEHTENTLLASIRQLEASGGATFENRHRCKNGDILDVEVTARMMDIPGKRMLIGVWRDVTESKRAEAKLRESETKYRELFEDAGDGIFIQNANGFIDCNEKGASMYGLTRAEVMGRHPSELAPLKQPDGRLSAEVAGEIIGRVMSGESRQFEWQALRADGTPLDVEINLSRIELKGEVCLQAVVRDITERKLAENALREREEIFSSIVNQAADSILLIDAETMGFAEFNRMAHESLGYTREEFSRLTLTDVQAQYNPEQLHRILDDAIASGHSMLIETQHRRKDGSLRNTQVSSRAITIRGKGYFSSVWSDITARKQAELKLQQSEAHFRFVTESAQALFWMSGPDKLCTWFNKVWLDFTGRTMEQEMGNGWVAGVHPDDVRRCNEIYLSNFERREPFTMEYRLRRHDGEYRWIVDNGAPRFNVQGVFEGYIGSCFDITDRKRNEENLRITASVFDTTQEAILITDANNIITEANPAFTRITGYSRDEVLGRNPKLLSSGRHEKSFYAEMWRSLKQEKAWRGEIWNRRKTGESYAELLSISVICDDAGKVQRHVAVFSDISYLKEHEAALSRIAHYDALTGIPNRMLLADRMRQAIAQTAREQDMMAVCYLDLDGFKAVNDTLGHEAGDQVLIEIAKRLGNTVRGGDTVARLGGDEFVVLLLGLERGEECMATLARLLVAIAQPIPIRDNQVTLGASIGVSIYPLDDDHPDTLLRHADQAMYVAKQSGKNRFYIYDTVLDQRARNRQDFLQGIRHGLEQGQFELYYQPKINLKTGRLAGAEALIRWNHPERGLLAPAEFLRLIVNTELDIELGEWVIATALAQMHCWRQAGLDIEVSINISAYHLESPRFAEKLRQQLGNYPAMLPGRLQIEVLEMAALEDIAVVRGIIDACHEFGVSFALDDFGTGYSSLSYLSSLPVDVLKIDQSFVRDMLEDKGDKAIVQGVIALAHAFDRQIVAEGVELEAHYQMLLEMGCEVGQGYGIARPMPAEAMLNWQNQRLER